MTLLIPPFRVDTTLALTNSRRLTGPNLYWDKPSAIIDVAGEGSLAAAIDHWSCAAEALLKACSQSDSKMRVRVFEGGASLLISASIDALYAMCELNEVAWQTAVAICNKQSAPDFASQAARLDELFANEARPRLLQLQQKARDAKVPFLWDDDEVSLGYGNTSQTWPYEDMPDGAGIDWCAFKSIPCAMITGTNGKSTTVRMTASIITQAGLCAGLTSTDFIKVGEKVIESGDYSGPGGARQLMRQPEVDIAVLEVARGGLMRRGLGLNHADTALITNVAADHFGEYGINTVADLIEAKFVIKRALQSDKPLILNADDAGLLEYAQKLDNRIWWFSMDSENEILRQQRDRGRGACWLHQGALYTNIADRQGATTKRLLVPVEEITASRNGRLRHNIQNAMGACLVSLALGLPDEAIRAGLRQFRGDETDNPGRGNWFEHDGVRILVDFAHNEHGLQALADSILAMNAERVVLMLGQAGDRDDELIRSLARAGCSMNPGRLLVSAMPGYERGRDLWDAPEIIRDEALSMGLEPGKIEFFDNLMSAARDALEQSRRGDVLVLLALTQRKEVLELIHGFVNG